MVDNMPHGGTRFYEALVSLRILQIESSTQIPTRVIKP